MLYRGSEIMREVAWVIFDEIHYMRDKGMTEQKTNLRFLEMAGTVSVVFSIKNCNKSI